MALIQLPNGSWVDPHSVRSIVAYTSDNDGKATHFSVGVSCAEDHPFTILCPKDKAIAEGMRDEIANRVNEALRRCA